MCGFKVDRQSLPEPWDNPLLFRLTRGAETVEAEVRREAALDYSWPRTVNVIAAVFTPERIEDFLMALEAAVDRNYDEPGQQRIILDWNALYPDGF
jgi:hypothetical protein